MTPESPKPDASTGSYDDYPKYSITFKAKGIDPLTVTGHHTFTFNAAAGTLQVTLTRNQGSTIPDLTIEIK